ncbi:hypothetical protein RCG23_23650 [Neobacillus sp. PS3-34]|uniref:hypothetical protein n=1 Tax=Neobacillus sp. PS3-34 TaxID=3070678 RepID=UPI0027E1F372|nr:hypothetical protein [Neobacillus sp. PS3-34]WML48216.1 hypothetical protein RCG23_23650 [Neobacillus sp. PS3-34]
MMFGLFKSTKKGSSCCNIEIKEVKEEECCAAEEKQACCTDTEKQDCCSTK